MTTRESGGIDHRHLAVSPGAADSSAGSVTRDGIISVGTTLTLAGIHDSAGRYLAPPQDAFVRAAGPWDDNTEPVIKTICCWCTPHHVMREGIEPASHGACERGVALFESGGRA